MCSLYKGDCPHQHKGNEKRASLLPENVGICQPILNCSEFYLKSPVDPPSLSYPPFLKAAFNLLTFNSVNLFHSLMA